MRKRDSSRSNNTVPGFLSKTYKILENAEYTEIISWNEDGKAFKVKKPNEFAEKVLPKYFKTNNFASFVRQLNMYDFHKLRHDSEENEWRHKLFRRGFPNLLSEIRRKINETQVQDAVVTQKEQKKITNDTQLLLKEMSTLKQKHESLEKACGVLIAQNTQILGENKLLWGELNKKKEKSMKKIENLFSLFFTYIGPRQIPELALMNSKKHSDFLKHENFSMEDNEEEVADSQVRGGGANLKQNQWNFDLNNSMNMFPFNSIHPQPPPPSHFNYNGGNSLNASNIIDSSVPREDNQDILLPPQPPTQSLSLVDNDDQNICQKMLEGILKNMKNIQEEGSHSGCSSSGSGNNSSSAAEAGTATRELPQSMGEERCAELEGIQFNSFVDNFHKTNTEMLQSLANFMKTQGAATAPDTIDFHNQIEKTAFHLPNSFHAQQQQPPHSDDHQKQQQQQQRNLHNNEKGTVSGKRGAVSIAYNDIKGVDNAACFGQTVVKRFKKEDGGDVSAAAVRFPAGTPSTAFSQTHHQVNGASCNPNFSLDEYLSFNNNSTGAAADLLNMSRASFDFSKLLQGGGDYQTLALPQSTTLMPVKQEHAMSPRQKGLLNLHAPSIIQRGSEMLGGGGGQNKSISNADNNNRLLLYGGGDGAAKSSSALINNPHQQIAQWDDFNQFINEQKIEQSLSGGSSVLTTSMQGGNSDRIEPFLNKEDDALKLNKSLL